MAEKVPKCCVGITEASPTDVSTPGRVLRVNESTLAFCLRVCIMVIEHPSSQRCLVLHIRTSQTTHLLWLYWSSAMGQEKVVLL